MRLFSIQLIERLRKWMTPMSRLVAIANKLDHEIHFFRRKLVMAQFLPTDRQVYYEELVRRLDQKNRLNHFARTHNLI